MARSKSSKQWLQEHFSDNYVKEAQAKGYRSRAAFKLLEIQEKDHILQPGMVVVDLGAAPGSWTQVAAECLHNRGKIFALDILPMDPFPNVSFIQGDFRETETLDALRAQMGDKKADVILSDMAPNMSGIDIADQTRALYLAELALELAEHVLKPEGTLLVKVFQGVGFDTYLKQLRSSFKTVITRKPHASRNRSRELYLLAKQYKTR